MTGGKMGVKSTEKAWEICINEMWEVKPWVAEERVPREHLFYGLTIVGSTSSTQAAKIASSDDDTSMEGGHQSGALSEEPCLAINILQSFKIAFSFLLVLKTQPIWNKALPLRLFSYLTEYTYL